MNEKHYSIAIDGPGGAGKSTIARAAAKELGFVYLDTGAIYRTVGWGVKSRGVDAKDRAAVEALLPELHVDLRYEDGFQHMLLNGEDVTESIRLPEMSMYASNISAIPAVRDFLLDMQRDMAKKYDIIMDGRDIGTVVLPQADVKIFLTASPEDRAQRRCEELALKGTPRDYEELLEEIRQRDYQDSHRDIAPLKQAEDAVLLDTTGNTFEKSRQEVLDIIKERIDL